MNWKLILKNLLIVVASAVVTYVLNIIPSVHISPTFDPIILPIVTMLGHLAEQYLTSSPMPPV